MKVTVFDFTGIYENESFDFCKREGFRSLFVDLKDISGTNCICDDYAFEEIRKRIIVSENTLNAQGGSGELSFRFFDNGNYHYMSRILMNATVPFDLVVFDHHPDMKWTSYGEILSCGCWVLSALKNIPELSKVYIVGADKALMEEAYADNPEYKDRVFYFEDCMSLRQMLETTEDAAQSIYISVDKDVLSRDELITNWDQGEMTLEELKEGLSFLKAHYGENIVAVDVCGECAPDDPDAFSEKGFDAGNRINAAIMDAFS
jgi:hypothetical protein